MNPASTMKIVTTYSALHLLGPAFTFRTEVLADGPLAGDVLRGELYVRGGGDPHLVIENLWQLVTRLRGFGIRDIRGDLVLDKTLFEQLPHDPGQFDGEEGRAYNVGPDALLVNFKSIAVTFVPDTAARVARVMVVPEVAGMKYPRMVPGVEGGCGDWRGTAARRTSMIPMNIRIGGAYPLACGERAIYLGALGHTNYFARGVPRPVGTPGRRVDRQGARGRGFLHARGSIAAQESEPLSSLIRDINKFSNNVMTQQLFLTMGAAGGEPGNPARGAAAVRGLLAARGIAAPELDPGEWLRAVAHRTHFGRHAGQRAGRCLEQPVDERAHGLAADLRRRRHHAGAQRVCGCRAHEDRHARGHARGSGLCAGGQRQALCGGGHHQPPERRARPGAHDALLEWVYRTG